MKGKPGSLLCVFLVSTLDSHLGSIHVQEKRSRWEERGEEGAQNGASSAEVAGWLAVGCSPFPLAPLQQCRKTKFSLKKSGGFWCGFLFSLDFNLYFQCPPSALLFKKSIFNARSIHKQTAVCSNCCTLPGCPLRVKLLGGRRSKGLVCVEQVIQKTRGLG